MAYAFRKNMIKYGCSVVASRIGMREAVGAQTKPLRVEISHCYAHVEQIHSTEMSRSLGSRLLMLPSQSGKELGRVNNGINQTVRGGISVARSYRVPSLAIITHRYAQGGSNTLA